MPVSRRQNTQLHLQKKLVMSQAKKKRVIQKMIQRQHSMKSALMKPFNISRKKKSGVLYFEFSSCPWCKEAKPILKKVAKDNGIDIQYVKVRDEEKNRLYTDEQKAIIEPYIQDYMSNNDEGILTLYVPLVLVVKNGKAIDGHEGTLESHDATERKMTDDEKKELTQIYTKLMGEAK